MKISTKQARNFTPTIGRIVTALALVSVMGSMSMTPALSKDDGDRRGHADKGLHKGEWRGDRRYEGRPVYREPYVYAQPVYVPPPVYYYPPPPSPGVSLFFPLNIRIR